MLAGASLTGDSGGLGRSGYSHAPGAGLPPEQTDTEGSDRAGENGVGIGLRELDTDGITGSIIGGAIDVHRYLGPGMLEHTYEVCLDSGISFQLSGISHRPLADR